MSVVVASNEKYAMGLTVMVRSLLENLRKDVAVDLYIMEDEISPASKRIMEDSWAGFPVQVTWISPDKTKIEGKVQETDYAGLCVIRTFDIRD